MSVQNQKNLTINKPNIKPPFLQISESDWQEAAQVLTYSAFKVYLYLAQNTNGYNIEYSPRAIENNSLMAHSTATKARQELEDKGYIENNIFYVESKAKRQKKKELMEQL